ncbi:MAG: cysteine hydrolase [Candidatus Schekmanbacteria bacterium]|nr:cysteine hydrolase [Candidatus Schekmanbacteria bacterium]
MNEVIIIVDMLKGFLQPGYPLFCGEKARRIIPFVAELLQKYSPEERIYVCDHHPPDDAEFKIFPPHCISGTEETKIIYELVSCPGIIVPKTRYSGFYKTDLEGKLEKLVPKRVTVVGVCTDICVMYTVADLRNRDYRVWVPIKGVASFDEEAHLFALKHMQQVLGAEVN